MEYFCLFYCWDGFRSGEIPKITFYLGGTYVDTDQFY